MQTVDECSGVGPALATALVVTVADPARCASMPRPDRCWRCVETRRNAPIVIGAIAFTPKRP